MLKPGHMTDLHHYSHLTTPTPTLLPDIELSAPHYLGGAFKYLSDGIIPVPGGQDVLET